MAAPPSTSTANPDPAERARERETYRYGARLLKGSAPNFPDDPVKPSLLRSSPDAALTAFAQLAVLRLGVSRALVSLFDSTSQHIVAEATPDICLQPESLASSQNSLWLTGTAIHRSFGICDHILLAPQEPPPPDSHDDNASPMPVTVVSDLAADPQFADRPFVTAAWPYCRFFAGVPIRTRHGVNIGVFCVFDDKPRDALSSDDHDLMRDLSTLIMTQLEARRIADTHGRTERMVRGIARIVDGSPLSTGQAPQSARDAGRSDDEDSYQTAATARTSQSAIVANDKEPSSSAFAPTASRRPTEPARSDSHISVDSQSNTEADYPTQEGMTFKSAAKTLREAVEADGVIYLEAGGSSLQSGFHKDTSGAAHSSSSSSDDSAALFTATDRNSPTEPVARVLGFSGESFDAATAKGVLTPKAVVNFPQTFLRQLLRRYPRGNVFNFDQTGSVQSSDLSSEEASPDGGEDADALKSRAAPAKPVGRQTRMKRSEQKMLMRLLPGARCVAFAPMWNPQSQRWFAGTFAYTRSPTRVFDRKSDLSYLTAFGAVVVSEVSRLKATLADKSKMDMLSSLSHELRSPLHGVVLGVDMLHDSNLDGFQADVLRTVETCGRTLLDTVDHLLHWTKINNFTTKAAPKRASRSSDGKVIRLSSDKSAELLEAGMMSITANIAVDLLAEETVESVFAGHTYQRLLVADPPEESFNHNDRAALRRLDRATMGRPDILTSTDATPTWRTCIGVAVSLDIEPSCNWIFHTQAGALRRVIMNLLGNSLKYTADGFIRVKLSQRSVPSFPGQLRTRHNAKTVCLTVSDSGRGISDDYLKNSLFVPFSQENRLNPGVGLGLSLVKKIISALRGQINVQSTVGIGTTVSVELPLEVPFPHVSPSSLPSGRGETVEDDFLDQASQLKGLCVRLAGFSQAKPNTEHGAVAEHAILTNVCHDWLHMEIASGDNDAKSIPDMILCSDSHLSLVSEGTLPAMPPRPIVVLCCNAAVARGLERKYNQSINGRKGNYGSFYAFNSQPVGPRKLARIMAGTLERWKNMSTSNWPEEGEIERPGLFRDEVMRSTDSSNLSNGSRSEGGNESSTSTSVTPPDMEEDDSDSDRLTSNVVRDRFLLVDDNPINLKILSSCMKKLDQPFCTASNGQEAVEVFKRGEGSYKCIFMDVSMPVMDGFEATSAIRQLEKNMKLAPCNVFALTGLASAGAQQEALACGVDLFLTKPLKLKELSQILTSRGLI